MAEIPRGGTIALAIGGDWDIDDLVGIIRKSH